MEYGSSWCAHCQEMFPHFYRLSAQVSAPLPLPALCCFRQFTLPHPMKSSLFHLALERVRAGKQRS